MKPKKTTTTMPNDAAITAPEGLTKTEKVAFDRIVSLKEAADHPVTPGEIDAVADLVRMRTRIASLSRLFRSRAIQAEPKSVLAVAKQLDSSVALAARLAKGLRLDH